MEHFNQFSQVEENRRDHKGNVKKNKNVVKYYGSVVTLTEKAMAPHSSTLAWKIPWTEDPGRLQSMGSLGVRHDYVTFK